MPYGQTTLESVSTRIKEEIQRHLLEGKSPPLVSLTYVPLPGAFVKLSTTVTATGYSTKANTMVWYISTVFDTFPVQLTTANPAVFDYYQTWSPVVLYLSATGDGGYTTYSTPVVYTWPAPTIFQSSSGSTGYTTDPIAVAQQTTTATATVSFTDTNQTLQTTYVGYIWKATGYSFVWPYYVAATTVTFGTDTYNPTTIALTCPAAPARPYRYTIGATAPNGQSGTLSNARVFG